jgi:hypothetical protein
MPNKVNIQEIKFMPVGRVGAWPFLQRNPREFRARIQGAVAADNQMIGQSRTSLGKGI